VHTEKKNNFNEQYPDLLRECEHYGVTPEVYIKTIEDFDKSQENKKNRTILYDPVDKKRRNYADCKKRYGQDIADKMLRAKMENNGRLNQEDYNDLMNRYHKGFESANKTKSLNHNRKNKPFIMIYHELLKNAKVRKIMKKSMVLYLYLRCHIVREKFEGDRLNLFGRYFKKGRLAASISIRKLAKDLYIDEKTVAVYIKQMSSHGVLEIDKIFASDAYDNQSHSVYVFGRHDFRKHETYYIEEIEKNDQ
jgi:hypothetical protein